MYIIIIDDWVARPENAVFVYWLLLHECCCGIGEPEMSVCMVHISSLF